MNNEQTVAMVVMLATMPYLIWAEFSWAQQYGGIWWPSAPIPFVRRMAMIEVFWFAFYIFTWTTHEDRPWNNSDTVGLAFTILMGCIATISIIRWIKRKYGPKIEKMLGRVKDLGHRLAVVSE